MKHTPGPWKYRIGYDEGAPISSVIMATTECLADIHDLGRDRLEEHEANARLIAAAPEMLEVCKAALVQLRREAAFTVDDRISSVIDKLEAVITSATGE